MEDEALSCVEESIFFPIEKQQNLLNLVYQPHPSSLCGQCCVATAAGVSLEEAIKVFGKSSSTSVADLIAALEHFGFSIPQRRRQRISKNIALPKRCIVTQGWPVNRGTNTYYKIHWRLHWDGHTYDPIAGIDQPIHPPEARITSYLEIRTQKISVEQRQRLKEGKWKEDSQYV